MKRNAPKSPEYQNFSDALGKVLKVSRTDMQQKLETAKAERKPSIKRASSSGRASRAKD